MINIYILNNFFLEKAVFSEKTAKNCYGGAFDHFFGERELLRQKITLWAKIKFV